MLFISKEPPKQAGPCRAMRGVYGVKNPLRAVLQTGPEERSPGVQEEKCAALLSLGVNGGHKVKIVEAEGQRALRLSQRGWGGAGGMQGCRKRMGEGEGEGRASGSRGSGC